MIKYSWERQQVCGFNVGMCHAITRSWNTKNRWQEEWGNCLGRWMIMDEKKMQAKQWRPWDVSSSDLSEKWGWKSGNSLNGSSVIPETYLMITRWKRPRRHTEKRSWIFASDVDELFFRNEGICSRNKKSVEKTKSEIPNVFGWWRCIILNNQKRK